MDETLYTTGLTHEGRTLVGGLWTMWTQEGFPLELSRIALKDRGCDPDWAEAMADASRTGSCPALMSQLEALLPEGDLLNLKAGFMRIVASGVSWDDFLKAKRRNGEGYLQALKNTATCN